MPTKDFKLIPDLSLNPMGVANHIGINSEGSFEEKLRVTHDLSFPGAVSDESVNSRVLSYELEPCMFGHTLLRIIHQLVSPPLMSSIDNFFF